MPDRARQYSGDDTVLIACSVCGNSFEYPTEILRTSDGLWRCTVFDGCGAFYPTRQEYDRTVATSRSRFDRQAVQIPGQVPNWFTDADE